MLFDHITLISVAQAAETVTAEGHASLLGSFGVDWFRFVAQLFNFLVILFVLHRWVFTPVAKKLHERTEKIDRALKDAEAIEEEKAEFEQWKKENMAQARKDAAAVLEKAEKESEASRQETLSKTRAEQEKLVKQAQAQIASDQSKMMEEVKGSVADLVVSATEKILNQKLDGKTDLALIKKSIEEASKS